MTRMLCWTESLTGGSNWEPALPEALSFSSICNPLADDAAGAMLWSGRNSIAQLRRLRDPVAGDNIGMALTEALHQAIETELDREQRPAHHFVNFAITAHGFTHAYQTANFTVGEFLQSTARLDEMLATLAGKLNSNESFNPDRGFQVDVVFVSMPGPETGRRKNTILVVCVWTKKTRKNDASSPSKTEMPYAVLAPFSPCEPTATKIKALTNFANGTV